VKAVKAWLQAASINEGALFRPVAKGGRLGAQRLTDDKGCATFVKAYAARLGLKAADFGAHSRRAGLTAARRAYRVAGGVKRRAGFIELLTLREVRRCSPTAQTCPLRQDLC
jgi:hypothetical protein